MKGKRMSEQKPRDPVWLLGELDRRLSAYANVELPQLIMRLDVICNGCQIALKQVRELREHLKIAKK